MQALDPPRVFAAYLHAIKWSCVTATNARLFQAPFRLAPLRKALELPRANLFIADDVGLGKTVEAGLLRLEREREDEPAEIVVGYEVVTRRLEPLGMVYLWPQNR